MSTFFHHQLLCRVRVELGLTQEDAARAVGVDVRTYRRYESGEVNESGGFALQRASRRRILERISRELGIEATELLVTAAPPAPSAPALVPEALPRARHFVGRQPHLARLEAWLAQVGAPSRVLAVVAMGGAGKTSLVERALQVAPQWLSVWVHSFYEEPSVDQFLERTRRFLLQSGGDSLEDVLLGLRQRPDAMLVLDGLEVMQASGEQQRARGELEDRRLVRLFRAVLREAGLGRILVTSRFRLADLAAFEGRELEVLELPPLDPSETRELLRAWGAKEPEAATRQVHESTGGHALSIAVLGSFAGGFLNGDWAAAEQLDLADASRDEPLARRLSSILARYAAELTPLERDLLGHICIFPRGASHVELERLPAFESADGLAVRAALGRLVQRGLVMLPGERYSAHPFLRAQYAPLVVDAAAIHGRERARLEQELEGQPLQRPTGPLLDAYERLFEHTLLSGDVVGASYVAERTMGGFAHLGLRLGEFERGLRLVRALEPSRAALPADVSWRLRYNHGLYSAALGDLDGAVRAYRSMLGQSDDVTTHRTLAYTLRLLGELDEAHYHVERSLELGRRLQARAEVVRSLALRGCLFTVEGRLSEAGAAFEEARALGDVPAARRSIWVAEYHLARHDWDQAEELTRDNLQVCEARSWAGHVAHCHLVLGRVALARETPTQAEAELDRALDWCLRSREVELTLEAKLLELELALSLGDTVRADATRTELVDAATSGSFRALLRAAAQAGR